jgi:hypothetical protein
MQASLSLSGAETRRSVSIRILGVWIDRRPTWGPHVKEVLRNMESQSNALTRTEGEHPRRKRHPIGPVGNLKKIYRAQ